MKQLSIINSILLIFFLTLMPIGLAADSLKTAPVAQNGVLDLRNWDLKTDGPVDMAGEWEFYWNKFLHSTEDLSDSPEKDPIIVNLPNLWVDLKKDGEGFPPEGYATYRLKVLLNQSNQYLAFKVEDINTAFNLVVNGKSLGGAGKTADSIDQSIPLVKPQVIDFYASEDELDIILHVSNYHDSIAGVRLTPEIGLEKDIRQLRESAISFEFLLFGAILIMALYHLGLYILRKNDPSALHFSLFCFIIAMRTLLTGERIFTEITPWLPWTIAVKIEILTFFLAIPTFAGFVHSIFGWKFSTKFLRFIQVFSVVCSLAAVIPPVIIGTRIMPVFQIFTLLIIIYVLYVTILSIRHKKEGSVIFISGFLLLALTATNDILYAADLIHTGFFVQFGVFAFIFSQAFLLSSKFSKAFTRVEILSEELQEKSDELSQKNIELQEHKDNLEQKVIERTDSIKVLLDNTGQGFLTFRPNYNIDPLYSKACRTFFSEPIEQQNALELLFGDRDDKERSSIDEMIGMVFNGMADLDVLYDIMPKEIKVGSKILKLDYRLIPPIGTVTEQRMMLILTDITLERQLSDQIREEEDRKELIVKIAIDKAGFIEFIHDMKSLFRSIYELLTPAKEGVDTDALFRCYHTIKGTAATYALSKVAEKAHHIESVLDPIRSGEKPFTTDLVEEQIKELRDLETEFMEVLNEFEDIIPEEEINVEDRFYQISDSKIMQIRAKLEELLAPDLIDSVRQFFDILCRQPVAPVLRRYKKAAEELAEKLEKEIEVEIEGSMTEVSIKRFESLFSTAIHLVRNSVDHGLETPDVRSMQEKSSRGKLKLQTSVDDKEFKLIVSDDGNGIDVDHIKKICIQKKSYNRIGSSKTER